MSDIKYSAPTEDQVKGQLRIYSKKAEETLKDKKKLEALLARIKVWLSKHRYNRVFGSTIESIIDMVDLLTDYSRGVYKSIPVWALISLVAAVLYIVSPIDLIPDWIVGVGWIDDIAVVTAVLKFGLDGELQKYRFWKRDCEKAESNLEAERFLRSVLSTLSEDEVVAAVFLTDDEKIEFLVAKKDCQELPLPARVILENLPTTNFALDETITQYKALLRTMNIEWSKIGSIDFMMEREYDKFDESFVIIGD